MCARLIKSLSQKENIMSHQSAIEEQQGRMSFRIEISSSGLVRRGGQSLGVALV